MISIASDTWCLLAKQLVVSSSVIKKLMKPIFNSDICPISHFKLKFVFIKDDFSVPVEFLWLECSCPVDAGPVKDVEGEEEDGEDDQEGEVGHGVVVFLPLRPVKLSQLHLEENCSVPDERPFEL